MKFITLHVNEKPVYINVEAIEAVYECNNGKAGVMVKSHNNGGFPVGETPAEVMMLLSKITSVVTK